LLELMKIELALKTLPLISSEFLIVKSCDEPLPKFHQAFRLKPIK
jgi:hypothetical protein